LGQALGGKPCRKSCDAKSINFQEKRVSDRKKGKKRGTSKGTSKMVAPNKGKAREPGAGLILKTRTFKNEEKGKKCLQVEGPTQRDGNPGKGKHGEFFLGWANRRQNLTTSTPKPKKKKSSMEDSKGTKKRGGASPSEFSTALLPF